jgi:prevent-host-death family protein
MYNLGMDTILSITDARKDLPKLVDRVSKLTQTVLITVQGKVKAALISAEELENMQDTIDLLSDKKAMASIRQGIKDVEEGRTVSWETVKKELGL